MSSEEYTEWQIIDANYRPIGEWRELRVGEAVADLVNLLRLSLHRKADFPLVKPTDWLHAPEHRERLAKAALNAKKQAEKKPVGPAGMDWRIMRGFFQTWAESANLWKKARPNGK